MHVVIFKYYFWINCNLAQGLSVAQTSIIRKTFDKGEHDSNGNKQRVM